MISVIIPAAGMAKRMRPLSTSSSKAMIPINGKPIISYILDELNKFPEIDEIIVVQNEMGDIENFCSALYPSVKFAMQKNPEGPLHAIKCGYDAVSKSENSIFVWLGDTICINQDFNFKLSFLGVHSVSDKERWCLVDNVDDKIVYHDKPDYDVKTDKALIGLYYFNDRKRFDDCIVKAMSKPKIKGEFQISTLLNEYKFFMLKDCANNWYDCGELSTYYESKGRLLTNSARYFNTLSVDTHFGILTKTSFGDNSVKIQNEKNWYNSLTDIQSLFTPRILKSEFGCLKMAWEPGVALNEIFLYESLTHDTWKTVISRIVKIIHETFHSYSPMGLSDIHDTYVMYIKKPLERIECCRSYDEYDRVKNFVYSTGCELMRNVKFSNVIHGDLHFGNILFDSHNGSIKFIDPRGIWGESATTKGDARYDFAKLMHDWFGTYIITNSQRLLSEQQLKTFEFIKTCFIDELKNIFRDEDIDLILKLSVILTITCIPMHSDNAEKQKKLWETGLTLIKNIQGANV